MSTTALRIPGSPADYWLKDLAHVDNMTVTIAKKNAALGLVPETHVVVEGQVIYRRHEDDGDIHFKLIDPAGNVLTCEIDPQDQAHIAEPDYLQLVRVYGILRYDLDHGWWEIHPVDYWEPAEVTPTPAP